MGGASTFFLNSSLHYHSNWIKAWLLLSVWFLVESTILTPGSSAHCFLTGSTYGLTVFIPSPLRHVPLSIMPFGRVINFLPTQKTKTHNDITDVQSGCWAYFLMHGQEGDPSISVNLDVPVFASSAVLVWSDPFLLCLIYLSSAWGILASQRFRIPAQTHGKP